MTSPLVPRPSSTLRRFLFLAPPALLLMRAATACGGSDSDDATPGDDGGAGGADAYSSAKPPGRDAAVADAAPPEPPSYCKGIVFYASFDKGYRADFGGGRTVTEGRAPVAASAGRFGNAVTLANGDPDASTAIFYERALEPTDAGDGGDAAAPVPVIYPEQEGSLVYWYKRTAPETGIGSHVRPMAKGAGAPGLVVASEGGDFGLWDDLGANAVLTVQERDLVPYRHSDAPDHIAIAWRKEDLDAGARALARLAINGGTGEIIGDAGATDAAFFADASPDDAGFFHTPYRAQTMKRFFVGGVLDRLRLGGVPGTAPQGAFDDLAIWNRVLSFDEMADIYRATESIGAVCNPR